MSEKDRFSLRIGLLREQHQQLDDEIDKAGARRWISPREATRLKELKVRRLRLKDLIASLERDHDT